MTAGDPIMALPDDPLRALLAVEAALGRGEISPEQVDGLLCSNPVILAAGTESISDVLERLRERAAGDDRAAEQRLAFVVFRYAFVLSLHRRPEPAICLLDSSASVFERCGAPGAAARCRSLQAAGLSDAGRPLEAAWAYEKAGLLFDEANDPDTAASCWMAGASLLNGLGLYTESLSLFDRAEPILTTRGPELEAARCQMGRASALVGLERYGESVAAYDRAEPVLAGRLSELSLAACRLNRAESLMLIERYDEACAEFDRIEPVFEAEGEAYSLARCRVGRGRAHFDRGLYEQAIADFERAIPILTRASDPPADWVAKAAVHLASALAHTHRHAEAVEAFDRAEVAFRALGLPDANLVAIWLERAQSAVRLGRFEAALVDVDRAALTLSDHRSAYNLALWRMTRADALRGMGRLDEALADYDRAGEEFDAQGSASEAARCHDGRASVLLSLGRFEEAVRESTRAAEGYARLGMDEAAAQCQAALARAAFGLGRFAESLAAAEQAEPVLALSGSGDRVSECRMIIARSLVDLGHPADAVEAYGRLLKGGLSEANEAGMEYELAVVLTNLGRYQEALESLGRCQERFERLHSSFQLALCAMQRSNVLRVLGRFEEALAGYSAAENILEHDGAACDPRKRREALARCWLNRANVLLEAGRHDLAARAYLVSAVEFSELGDELESARCEKNRAAALIGLGLNAEAVAACERASLVFSVYGQSREAALCRMNRSSALLGLSRPEEAVSLLEETDPSVLNDDELAKFYLAHGTALSLAGRQSEALAKLARAREALRRARQTSGITEADLDFVATRQKVIRAAVALALEADRPRLAHEAVQDGKAALLGDGLGFDREPTGSGETRDASAERSLLCEWLRNETKPGDQADSGGTAAGGRARPDRRINRTGEAAQRTRAYLSAWERARPMAVRPAYRRQGADPYTFPDPEDAASLDRVQACLPEDWAVLDFWARDAERMGVFVITRGDLEFVTLPLPVTSPAVTAALHDLSLWGRDSLGGRVSALDMFFDLVIAPLMPRLRGLRGLYLVPHSYLHQVPLHACLAPDGRYLGDMFEIGYLPSAALLPRLAPLAPVGGPMLTLANPDRGTELTLPFSEWEADRVQKSLAPHQHRAWAGRAATLDRVATWNRPSLVHFTCHGFGHARFASTSHLRLADDLLLAHDVVHRTPPLQPGALAVLNGCETGVRDWRAVDEGMGLMTAFLLRGASLVASTQWIVEDACAAEMAATFMDALIRDGQSPAQALRKAQERARQVTLEEVESRCRELLDETFRPSECPHEAVKLSTTAMEVCLRGGQSEGARHYARLAARALRELGSKGDETESGSPGRLGPEASPMGTMQDPAYEHPAYWSALHLIGRVT